MAFDPAVLGGGLGPGAASDYGGAIQRRLFQLNNNPKGYKPITAPEAGGTLNMPGDNNNNPPGSNSSGGGITGGLNPVPAPPSNPTTIVPPGPAQPPHFGAGDIFKPTPDQRGKFIGSLQNAQQYNPLTGGTGDAGLDAYLGTDPTYQSQLSGLMQQYDQYNAQRNLQNSQTQADYDAKTRAMNTQTVQDQLNMRNAAAAHGILQSGIYANELGQYNDANQQQMTNLLGGLQNAKDTSQLAYQQELANLVSSKQQAIQQAAARRAAALGSF